MESSVEAKLEPMAVDDDDTSSTGAAALNVKHEVKEPTSLSHQLAEIQYRSSLVQQELQRVYQTARKEEDDKAKQLADRLAAEAGWKRSADEQQEKLAEAITQLDEMRGKMEAGAEREGALNDKLAAAETQLEQVIGHLEVVVGREDSVNGSLAAALDKLEKAGVQATNARSREAKLTEKNAALTKELEEMKKANRPTTSATSDYELQLKKRIKELERQVEAHRGAQPQPHSQHHHTPPTTPRTHHKQPSQTPQQAKPEPSLSSQFNTPSGSTAGTAVVESVPHATNILQICHPVQGTISYDEANRKLRDIFPNRYDSFLKENAVVQSEEHTCLACNYLGKKYHVIYHFFSDNHGRAVRSHRAAVSFAAVEYCKGMLEEVRSRMCSELNASFSADEAKKRRIDDDKN